MEESLNEPQNAKVAGIFYCLGLAVPIVSVVFLATNFVDFPDTFLVTCILETTLVILGKGFLRLVTFRKCNKSFENSQTSETKRETKRGVLCVFLRPLRVAYVLGTVYIGIAAFVFFFFKETTNKVKSPEQSRDLNQECYWLDFFDSHDIWHILSSFALLMSALLVIHVSYDPNTCENGKTEAKGNTGRNTGKKGGTRKTEAKGEMDLSMPLLEV